MAMVGPHGGGAGEQGPPKHKIELPRPGDDRQYGGTRTVAEAYQFDVANQIGEGTYGQVFTGMCKDTKAKVALKKIRMDTEKEGFPITAIREIKILSSMTNENVVNLREIVRSDIHKSNNFKGSIYMVFDYAEHDLTGLMDANKYRFTEAQVKCIMKQLLKGLAYVHGNGVLHRDLKASNILIDKNGVVKLADFGLARTYQEKTDARLTNRVITLWYRPPELLLGAERYGPEVDMWSVGCIFAELLVGKPLFPGKDEPDQLDRIFSIMGTPTKETWPDGHKLPSWGSIPPNRHRGLSLRKWVDDVAARNHQASVKPAAVQLLEKLLQVDPSKRIDALSAFKDPWFWNDDPPACAPEDLPCKGSSHEYTMKKRRQEAGPASTAMPIHLPGALVGVHDPSKRQRTGGHPPQGGGHGSYSSGAGAGAGAGGQGGRPAGPPGGGPSGGTGAGGQGGRPSGPPGGGPPGGAARGPMPPAAGSSAGPAGPGQRAPYGAMASGAPPQGQGQRPGAGAPQHARPPPPGPSMHRPPPPMGAPPPGYGQRR